MPRIPKIHMILFILTCISTTIAGAIQQGVDLFSHPSLVVAGIPFSATLMTILLSHEFSHYYASRMHNTVATLPYFIPAPSIIGTFGAFIKMKSGILSRRALIDIGASGPIVGFLFSVVASVVGLGFSKIVPVFGIQGGMTLGDSLLFSGLSHMILGRVPEGSDVLLHPVAFAGWIGFFVTSLNLIPIGQLDGGHIAFAMLGRVHRQVSIALVVTLGVLGFYFWPGWTVWAVLMLFMGIAHPPVADWEPELDTPRRAAGWAALVIFVLTFTPVPFSDF